MYVFDRLSSHITYLHFNVSVSVSVSHKMHDEHQHWRQDSTESLSFRHFTHHTSFPNLLQEVAASAPATDCASSVTTLTTPTSSPTSALLVSPSPGRTPVDSQHHWSYSSPLRAPPFHHPHILYHSAFSLPHLDTNIHSIVVSRGVVFTASTTPFIRAWTWRPPHTHFAELGLVKATSAGEIHSMLLHHNLLFTSNHHRRIRVWTISTHNDDNLVTLPRKIVTLPKQNPLRYLLPPSKRRRHSSQHKDMISCMAYNQADGLLYTGSHDKTVKAWSIADRKCVDTFVAHSDAINAMAINDEGYLFTCSSDGTLKMWRKVSGGNLHTLTMTLFFHPFPINTLAITNSTMNEGGFLYGGASDGGIYYWEQQVSGEYVRRGCVKGDEFAVVSVAAVAEVVVSGGADKMVRIWRRKGWRCECVGVLEGHTGPVKCVRVCLDEGSVTRAFMVFSSGLDRSFKAWRVRVLGDGCSGSDPLFDCASISDDSSYGDE